MMSKWKSSRAYDFIYFKMKDLEMTKSLSIHGLELIKWNAYIIEIQEYFHI